MRRKLLSRRLNGAVTSEQGCGMGCHTPQTDRAMACEPTYPWDIRERIAMTPSENEFSAALLGRLTDGLALIVCAAHALRAIEDMGADVAAVRSTLRQGIV